jgi:IS5 family transposase
MRQERIIQATLFEVFARHEIGCELKAISQWLDQQRPLVSLVASDLRRGGLRETGRRGLPAETGINRGRRQAASAASASRARSSKLRPLAA